MSESVTHLLHAWRGGDENALEALVPLVYQQTHALAVSYMRREKELHTLQATALVHEGFFAHGRHRCGLERSGSFHCYFGTRDAARSGGLRQG